MSRVADRATKKALEVLRDQPLRTYIFPQDNDELNKLAALYQAECRRSNEWRVSFEEMSDKRDGALEELRKALNRIKLLETEIERLANEP